MGLAIILANFEKITSRIGRQKLASCLGVEFIGSLVCGSWHLVHKFGGSWHLVWGLSLLDHWYYHKFGGSWHLVLGLSLLDHWYIINLVEVGILFGG